MRTKEKKNFVGLPRSGFSRQSSLYSLVDAMMLDRRLRCGEVLWKAGGFVPLTGTL